MISPTWLGMFCVALILLSMLPVAAALMQFLLVGVHGARNHYRHCGDFTPRVAVLVPAWNEGLVVAASIDMLIRMDYPAHALRIYVVDDASTDDTPDVVQAKARQYPGQVVHLRRERGGQGKAHTLNHGLERVLREPWAEAVLIMDADVLFEAPTLRRMARHLADPRVGSVTAYIKEGSQPDNLVSRYVAFEYVTAQAAARRAQNVMGALACLAGGAQLHRRENLIAIGGAIDTSTLAEDTFTTFRTQLAGNLAVFDGNAVVWAEEPGSLVALWKQRLRWSRGNLQLTRHFRRMWFNPFGTTRLSSIPFGMMWFSIVLMPVFMIMGSVGMVSLYLLNPAWAWVLLSSFWGLSITAHLFVTLYCCLIDPGTGRRAWFEGITYPGLVSLAIMLFSFTPAHLLPALPRFDGPRVAWSGFDVLMLAIYSWMALNMLAAWTIYRAEKAGLPRGWCNLLLVLVGYGPLQCAITFAAYVAEFRQTSLQWDKTEKSGKVHILPR